mgnify:CR=1 FL=1
MKKEYLDLALPSGFECIVGVLITMTDTFMISQFGSEIIASVGAMGTVIDFMYLVLQSINVSNNVIVARLLGKNDKDQAKNAVGTALIIAVICSLICIILTLSISKFIPKMFLVNEIGLVYLYIRLIGVMPNTILTILGGYQRTLGNSKRMFNIRMLCFFINVILDFIFVKLGFGITGVAISTVLVEIINMVVLIYYSKRLVKIKFVKSIAKEEFDLIRYNIYERIFKRGSNFILNVIMSRIGTLQYAAHIIVMQFLDLMNNFLHGTGIGTQTMVATSIGSNDNEKVNETTKVINNINKKIVYITTSIVGVAMLISLPFFLIEKESLIIGYKLLLFVILDCILMGFYHYYTSILRAMKEFKYISKLSLFISGGLRLILAYLLSKVCGIYGVWICYIISDFIMNMLLNKKITEIQLKEYK